MSIREISVPCENILSNIYVDNIFTFYFLISDNLFIIYIVPRVSRDMDLDEETLQCGERNISLVRKTLNSFYRVLIDNYFIFQNTSEFNSSHYRLVPFPL